MIDLTLDTADETVNDPSTVDYEVEAPGNTSSAVDSSAVDSGTVDSAAVDSIAVESTAVDSTAVDSTGISAPVNDSSGDSQRILNEPSTATPALMSTGVGATGEASSTVDSTTIPEVNVPSSAPAIVIQPQSDTFNDVVSVSLFSLQSDEDIKQCRVKLIDIKDQEVGLSSIPTTPLATTSEAGPSGLQKPNKDCPVKTPRRIKTEPVYKDDTTDDEATETETDSSDYSPVNVHIPRRRCHPNYKVLIIFDIFHWLSNSLYPFVNHDMHLKIFISCITVLVYINIYVSVPFLL